jgi:hypothetical protein
MDQPIISHDHIRAMARAAFERGDARESCAMKDRAPARQTWLLEFDRLAAAQASPASHIAPHRRGRVDLAHSGATHPQTQGA